MDEISQTELRILQVVRPAAGGMRRHVSLLCRGLNARGYRTAIAAPRGFVLEDSVSTPIKRVPISAHHHLAQDVRAAIAVARFAHGADVIHGHGMRGAWICFLASRRARKPFILTAHNLAPTATGQLAPRLIRATVHSAWARIAVSHAVAESFEEYGILKHAWTVIPNGVDLAAFENPPDRASVLRSLGLRGDARIVLGAGRLAPEKGFERLVESAALVIKKVPKAHFVLAGDGPEWAKLEEKARPLGSRFVMTGGYEAIYGLMAAADVIVVPSVEEGQGIVALEAMAARKPVVASKVGGLAETVQDGKTGILLGSVTPKSLADAVMRLLADSALRSKMGAAGRIRVENHYTASRMVDSTVDVYLHAAAQTGAAETPVT